MKPIPMFVEPLHNTSMHLLIDFSMVERMMSLLVVVDYFSKMMHIVLCKEGTGAYNVVTTYFAHIEHLYGLLATKISDYNLYF